MELKKEESEMMCNDREMLQGFVERRLSEADMCKVARHIVACEDCQNYVNFYANCLVSPEAEPSEKDEDLIRDIADEATAIFLKKLAQQAKVPAEGEWNRIIEAFSLQEQVGLAAADGQSGNQKQAVAAADAGFFYFYSHGRKDDPDPNAWRVRLAKPPSRGTSEKYLLQLRVEELDGSPIPDGTLMLCGGRYAVQNGRVFVPRDEFLAAVSKARLISLQRTNGEEVPGAPVF